MAEGQAMRVVFEDLLPGETPIDLSGLKVRGIKTRKDLSTVEALGIGSVFVDYFSHGPARKSPAFDFAWVKELHREMYGEVWDWAGQFRTQNINIGVDHWQIQTQLYDLIENLKVWESSGMDLLEQATRLHHRAVEIHPFPNGNGRWGRMLTNIWLINHDRRLRLNFAPLLFSAQLLE